ncbi:uncharacterized protein CC84DRAFT_482586 [Paraphaeosphaeria sporulosa]|uniref:Uncharacterized protein n=1 Tax=Paraphaeosphaeria sporulosa TaxID=1460663 RepID=A0A177CU02_9PLEO|nr:uncharacterized protein CC84DRAFT_482586 [Paraphaeosphaeria sporulosa]OAG10370.1 hypothetical protein CC84DRAFT_482586 [Paraphaeosphaeria sporulosa]
MRRILLAFETLKRLPGREQEQLRRQVCRSGTPVLDLRYQGPHTHLGMLLKQRGRVISVACVSTSSTLPPEICSRSPLIRGTASVNAPIVPMISFS